MKDVKKERIDKKVIEAARNSFCLDHSVKAALKVGDSNVNNRVEDKKIQKAVNKPQLDEAISSKINIRRSLVKEAVINAGGEFKTLRFLPNKFIKTIKEKAVKNNGINFVDFEKIDES